MRTKLCEPFKSQFARGAPRSQNTVLEMWVLTAWCSQAAKPSCFFLCNKFTLCQGLKVRLRDIKGLKKTFWGNFALRFVLLHDADCVTAGLPQWFFVTSNPEPSAYNDLRISFAKSLHYLFLVVSFSSFKMLALIS